MADDERQTFDAAVAEAEVSDATSGGRTATSAANASVNIRG